MTSNNHFKKNHRNLGVARNSVRLKAHHEMGPMGLGERFSFALERDDVRARLGDCLG
jgi:hypothetical protein